MECFLRDKWNHRPGAINCFCFHSDDRGGDVDFAQHLLAEYNFDLPKPRNKVGRRKKKCPGGVRTQKPGPK